MCIRYYTWELPDVDLGMADIEPYRFEPERSVVDDSSSTEDADSTEDVDGDDRRGSTEDGERVGDTEWCGCGTCSIMPTGKECLFAKKRTN